MISSYRDLLVWQKSIDFVCFLYSITQDFPKSEVFGIQSQMRRAAVSIPSNISEGKSRGSRKDYRHFIVCAYGSGAELETQLILSKRLQLIKESDYLQAEQL